MNKRILAAVVLSGLLLAGCSGKTTNSNSPASNTQNSNDTKVISSGQATKEGASLQRVEVKTDFEPVAPNTVPKLSSKQKSKIDSKISSTLDNIDKALKSLQEMPEIDLSSLEQ
jgi:PBP1b-binding outer membrane lipoprotein LpoB